MNKKDKSIIPLEQNALIRLENSMVITNEILSCQESRLYKLDWDFIIRHRGFFNEFLSSYYPFTEREIIDFIEKIEMGGMLYLGEEINDFDYLFGLLFNNNIKLSKKNKNIISEKGVHNEHLNEIVLGTEFNALPRLVPNIKDMPRNKIENIERDKKGWKGIILEKLNKKKYSWEEAENKLSNIDKHFSRVIYDKKFNSERIIKIIRIEGEARSYIANQFFCEALFNKIMIDIDDFSIKKFYQISQ
jgi:hypothetical protein